MMTEFDDHDGVLVHRVLPSSLFCEHLLLIQAFQMNVIAPDGEIPINIFTVLCFL